MEDAPDVPYEPIIPRPDIRDSIEVTLQDGSTRTIETNLDNTAYVRHLNGYERMNHIQVRLLGDFALRLFKIDATPLGDHFLERGYDIIVRQYPNDMTAAQYIQMELVDGMREWEKGDGHEFDE